MSFPILVQNYLISRFCYRPKKYLLCAPEESKYHNFKGEHQSHFYIAASQFYKMLAKLKYKSKTNEDICEALSSIEYVVQEKTLEIFNSKKRFFEEKGRGLNKAGKVKELLLFHGTDASKIDSILENNFSIDAVPNDRKKKMSYGRGVYMSEHPQMALHYGDTLLLCRVSSFHHTINYPKEKENTKNLQVLPGEVERLDWPVPSTLQGISEIHDSREVVRNNIGWIHVVKDEAQILPYCILHLTEGGGQVVDNASNDAGPSPGSQGHNPNSAGTPTGLMDNSQGPREHQN